MFSDDLNDLLSLFVAMILADKRVFSQEVGVFISGVKKLKSIHKGDGNISEAKLLAWYENNNNLISQKIRTPDFEPWLYGILSRLNRFDDKQIILDFMKKIALADDDYHVSEKALIALTASHWDMQIQA